MKIKTFVFNDLRENTYLIWDETKEAIIIDPGCYSNTENNELVGYIKKENLNLKLIINTHCHIDHVLGNYFVKNKYNIPLWIPEKEVETFLAVKVYAPHYGIFQYQTCEYDALIKENQRIEFGNLHFETHFLPGHSPGHLVFLNNDYKVAFCGDVIFYESIGRTDLPGGNTEQLLKSIKTKLFTWDEQTTLYPGHGPKTNVAHEKGNNPYVR